MRLKDLFIRLVSLVALIFAGACSSSDFGGGDQNAKPQEDDQEVLGTENGDDKNETAGDTGNDENDGDDANSDDEGDTGGNDELNSRDAEAIFDHFASEEVEGCALPAKVNEKLEAKGMAPADTELGLGGGWGGSGSGTAISLVNLDLTQCEWSQAYGLSLAGGVLANLANRYVHVYSPDNKSQTYVQPAASYGANHALCIRDAALISQELKAEGTGGQLLCVPKEQVGIGAK